MTIFFPLDTARLRLQGLQWLKYNFQCLLMNVVYVYKHVFLFMHSGWQQEGEVNASSSCRNYQRRRTVRVTFPDVNLKLVYSDWCNCRYALLWFSAHIPQSGSLQRLVSSHLQPVLLQLCLLLLLPQSEGWLAEGKAVGSKHRLNNRHRSRWGGHCPHPLEM